MIILVLKDRLKKLFDYITNISNDASAVAGLYLSRHQKRVVGGYYDNKLN